MGNTPSNHSELSDCEEDPTEATLIYETKQVTKPDDNQSSTSSERKSPKPNRKLERTESKSSSSTENNNKSRTMCWNEIDVEYFQKYQVEFELGPKCRHITFQDYCSDCEIYADFIQKKDHFCKKCVPAAKHVQAALREPTKQPIVVALKDINGDLAFV